MSKRLYYVAGFVLFGVAALELLAPNALGLPFGDGAAIIIGLFALLYSLTVLQSRRKQNATFVSTPDVELARPTEVPGERLDSVLDEFPEVDVNRQTPAEIRAGLERVAIGVLTRYGGYSEPEADEQIRRGTWTDDPVAAQYLGADSDRGRGSIRERLRNLFTRSGPTGSSVERTVDALVTIAGREGAKRDEAETRTGQGPPFDPEEIEGTTVDPGIYEIESGMTSGRRHQTHHWLGIGFVALVCLGVGILSRSPAVLLGAVVGIGYAAYARSLPLGTVNLSLTRTVSNATPAPEEDVEVTVKVTNSGQRPLTDIRLVDGVPESLAVTEGSPRMGSALRPGETMQFSYTLTPTRGSHEFNPVLAVVRNVPGSVEQETYLSDETILECSQSVQPVQRSVPLRGQVTGFPGQVETETGGAGIAFQTIREYHPGDPLSRIDWNHRARTGELATVDFRQERAATVVLLIDVRESAYIGPAPDAPTAVDRSVTGAGRIFERLLDDGNQVGIAAMGDQECWLPPGAGTEHRHRGRELLTTSPALSPTPPSSSLHPLLWSKTLRRRLTDGTQLIVFSPLCDPSTVRILQKLEARGYPLSVISPDPTATGTPAQKLVGLRRAMALTDLRQAGIPIIDWKPKTKLEAPLQAIEGGR